MTTVNSFYPKGFHAIVTYFTFPYTLNIEEVMKR